MPTEQLTFALRCDAFDAFFLGWLRQMSDGRDMPDAAVESARGFNLETLMKTTVGEHYLPPTPGYGRLATALHHFGYALFVNFGDPLVSQPAGFWPKCVSIIRAYQQTTSDDRRVVISVTAGADPVLIPIPAVPTDLLPTQDPDSFARSRESLLEFTRLCVDRVNLISGPALALAQSVKAGYPSGEIPLPD